MNNLEGKGKYDDECEEAFKKCHAEGCLLIVIRGRSGSGFSAVINKEIQKDLPQILRNVADEIEKQQKQAAQN